MSLDQLKPHKVPRGHVFSEPVEVLVTILMGNAVKLLGRGLQTSTVVDIILTEEELKLLETTPDTAPFDGDAKMFRLGIEAMRLGLASTPSLNILQDPATLDWQPVVKVEHYRLRQDSIKHPVELKEDSVPSRVGGTP